MHAVLSNNWHAQLPFLMDKALSIISQAGYGENDNISTLEPHGIFRSNFAYLLL